MANRQRKVLARCVRLIKYSAPMIRAWYPLCVTFFLAVAPLQAQNWLGGTNSDWNTASNWDPATVPTAASFVEINTNAGNMPVIGSGVSASASLMLMGIDGNSGSNTRLTVNSDGWLSAVAFHIGVIAGSNASFFVTGPEARIDILEMRLGHGINGGKWWS